jgi:F0F1-type ATP synthase assembly protein I
LGHESKVLVKSIEKKILAEINMAGRHKLYRFAHMGIYFAFIFTIFVLIGMYLDSKLEIKPWGTIGGALIGFPLALYRLLLMAKEMEREFQKKDPEVK